MAAATELVRCAAERGAEVLVLPELFLTGYELEAIAAHGEEYSVGRWSARLDVLSAACAETRLAVLVGAPVWDAALHISLLVLGPDGRLATRYDKQHLDSAERAAGFAPGSGGCSVTLHGWRLGLGICWDASFPGHAQEAAVDGCHAYLVSALFGGGRGVRKRGIIGPARALDNAMYVAMANHGGPTGPFTGCAGSAVWSPEGVLLAEAGGEGSGLAVARLEGQALARTRAEDFVLLDTPAPAFPSPRGSVVLL